MMLRVYTIERIESCKRGTNPVVMQPFKDGKDRMGTEKMYPPFQPAIQPFVVGLVCL
jgi:hypothetical protein